MKFASRLVFTIAAVAVGSVDVAAQSNVCTNVSGQIEGQIVGPATSVDTQNRPLMDA
jgi:hypothetical protein